MANFERNKTYAIIIEKYISVVVTPWILGIPLHSRLLLASIEVFLPNTLYFGDINSPFQSDHGPFLPAGELLAPLVRTLLCILMIEGHREMSCRHGSA